MKKQILFVLLVSMIEHVNQMDATNCPQLNNQMKDNQFDVEQTRMNSSYSLLEREKKERREKR